MIELGIYDLYVQDLVHQSLLNYPNTPAPWMKISKDRIIHLHYKYLTIDLN